MQIQIVYLSIFSKWEKMDILGFSISRQIAPLIVRAEKFIKVSRTPCHRRRGVPFSYSPYTTSKLCLESCKQVDNCHLGQSDISFSLLHKLPIILYSLDRLGGHLLISMQLDMHQVKRRLVLIAGCLNACREIAARHAMKYTQVLQNIDVYSE